MSNELKPVFYIKIEVGEYASGDSGFYTIFSGKEMANGVDNLIKAIAVQFNILQSYLDRRIKNHNFGKKKDGSNKGEI